MIKKEIIVDNIIYYIYIGQNKHENWKLIDDSDKNDLWFHLDSFQSPHIVLKYNEITSNQIINECCKFCKQHSKFKNFPSNHLKIIYTPINNLKKGTEIGSVLYVSKKKNNYIVV